MGEELYAVGGRVVRNLLLWVDFFVGLSVREKRGEREGPFLIYRCWGVFFYLLMNNFRFYNCNSSTHCVVTRLCARWKKGRLDLKMDRIRDCDMTI